MQNIASDRLRQTFNYWKDACRFLTETARMGGGIDSVAPAIRNWNLLEKRIFARQIEALNMHEWSILEDNPTSFSRIYGMYPFELFEWSRSSRRAIQLPRELQRPFASAPFPKVRFADIKLPFDSFILTLEEPLRVQEEEAGPWTEFDAIWVTRFPFKKSGIRCRLISRPHVGDDQLPLPQNALRRFEISLRRNRESAREEFIHQWTRWHDTIIDSPGRIIFPLYPDSGRDNDLVADFVKPSFYTDGVDGAEQVSTEQLQWRADWICSAAKIVIGWCLYLKHLPSESYKWDEQRLRQSRGTRGAVTGVITDPAHICTILRIGTMNVDEYRERNPEDTGSTFFQWPHWRSGHWKRERGAGPFAPKTVWIEPYKVREDLMPLWGIHGGKFTSVQTEL